MAIAFVALLAALSGTAVALPGTNTVDSGDIKNNTVRSRDLRNNDVRTQDIRNGTVRGSDVRNNSLTGDDILESSLGTVPSATSANAANTASNADRLDGLDSSAFQRGVRWALVQPAGTIAAQSGGISVTKGPAGRYGIDFGTPTAGRLVLVSSALANDIAFRGVVSAAPCTGGTPEAYAAQACPGGNSATKVEVFTDNPGETATQDHAFYVVLFP